MFGRDLFLPDPSGLYTVLAVVVANRRPGKPVWLVQVGAPSSGKTVNLDALDLLAEVHQVTTMTQAALLPACSPKAKPDGVLDRIGVGGEGLMVCKDLTVALKNHADERAETDVFDLLRVVYDGETDRRLGTFGGQHRHWHGKVGFIAACTEIIDRHAERLGSLGERFIYQRPAAVDRDAMRAWVVEHDVAIDDDEARRHRAATAKVFLDSLDLRATVTVDAFDRDLLMRLADLATRARSAVWRDGSSDTISLVPDPEMPMRVYKVFRQLFEAFRILSLDRDATWQQVGALALDAIAKARRLPLVHLLNRHSWQRMGDIASALNLPISAVVRPLEELAAHGVVEREGRGGGDVMWRAAGWAAETWALLPEQTRRVAKAGTLV